MKIAIVIFCKNTNSLSISTLNEIIKASKLNNKFKISLFFVDDGSSDDTINYLKKAILIANDKLKTKNYIVENKKSYGLADCILNAIPYVYSAGFKPKDIIMQLPGNDQVSYKSILALMSNSNPYTLVTSNRSNIEVRPIPKRIASKIMHFIVHKFIFSDIKQVTSNYTCSVEFANKWIRKKSRHAFGLWLILGAKKDKLIIKNISITLKSKPKYLGKNTSVRKWPKVSDSFYFLLDMAIIIRMQKIDKITQS